MAMKQDDDRKPNKVKSEIDKIYELIDEAARRVKDITDKDAVPIIDNIIAKLQNIEKEEILNKKIIKQFSEITDILNGYKVDLDKPIKIISALAFIRNDLETAFDSLKEKYTDSANKSVKGSRLSLVATVIATIVTVAVAIPTIDGLPIWFKKNICPKDIEAKNDNSRKDLFDNLPRGSLLLGYNRSVKYIQAVEKAHEQFRTILEASRRGENTSEYEIIDIINNVASANPPPDEFRALELILIEIEYREGKKEQANRAYQDIDLQKIPSAWLGYACYIGLLLGAEARRLPKENDLKNGNFQFYPGFKKSDSLQEEVRRRFEVIRLNIARTNEKICIYDYVKTNATNRNKSKYGITVLKRLQDASYKIHLYKTAEEVGYTGCWPPGNTVYTMGTHEPVIVNEITSLLENSSTTTHVTKNPPDKMNAAKQCREQGGTFLIVLGPKSCQKH